MLLLNGNQTKIKKYHSNSPNTKPTRLPYYLAAPILTYFLVCKIGVQTLDTCFLLSCFLVIWGSIICQLYCIPVTNQLWSKWTRANCSFVQILKMNVASYPSRNFCITGSNSKRSFSQLQGCELYIKRLKRQKVSNFCFDSFFLTSKPHLYLATFYSSSGSEPSSLLYLSLSLLSASTILKSLPAMLRLPFLNVLALLEPSSTKP